MHDLGVGVLLTPPLGWMDRWIDKVPVSADCGISLSVVISGGCLILGILFSKPQTLFCGKLWKLFGISGDETKFLSVQE